MKSIRHMMGGVFRFLLVFVAIFCCIFTALYVYLPRIIESRVLPIIKAQIGLENADCDIRSISQSGLDIGDLFVGTTKDPGLWIDAIYVDYSLSGILKKEIKDIHVSGLKIFSRYENGRLTIPGLFPSKLFDKKMGSKESADTPDFDIRHLKISNAAIIIFNADKSYEIPLEIEISPQTRFMQGMDIHLTAKPFDQLLEVKAGIDFIRNQCTMNVSSEEIRLEEVTEISDHSNLLTLSGKTSLNISAEMNLSPFNFSSVFADLMIDQFKVIHPNFELAPFKDKGAASPFRIHIENVDQKNWNIEISSLSLASPLPLQLINFKSSIEADHNKFTGKGIFNLALPENKMLTDLNCQVLSTAEIPGQYQFSYESETGWSFLIESLPEKKQKPSFKIADYTVSMGQLDLSISGAGFKSKGDTQFSLSFPNVTVISEPMALSIPEISLKGIAPVGSPENIADLKIEAKKSILKMDVSRVDLPLVALSGNVKKTTSQVLAFSGSVSLLGASFSNPSSSIRGINGNLPISWPWQKGTHPGAFSIKNIVVDNMNAGAVKGKWKQEFSGILFDGYYETDLIPGFGLDFNGKSGVFDEAGFTAALHLEKMPYQPKSAFDLHKLFPGAKDIQFDGRFEISGDLFYDRTGINSSLLCQISDGTLTMPQKDLSMKGITGGLTLTDVFQLKSAPKQRLEFSEAALGNINIQNGYVQFQIESPESYLIEKSGFNWCNGNVETLSLRILRDVSDYDITLFCDRLNLARILEQFGAADANGSGTVNGRIPLRYRNGRLTFNNGFLFSTPGDGGTIRVKGTERLTAGIDPDSPQFTQIELAREALRNYDYQWAKLNIETQGEDLLLKLKFDGKPSDPLPFVYKEEIGGFARVEAGGQGSVFQGINLDLNFRLPLDKILQYQNVFNMIK